MTHQPHDHRTTTWGKHAMPELTDLNADSPAKLSRRNVVVGTAWVVPAIALVGAAPAMASTGGVLTSVTNTGPGSSYKATFLFTLTGAQTGDTVTITQFGTGFVINKNQLPKSGTVDINTKTAIIELNVKTLPGNPKNSYTVTYTITGVSGTKSETFCW